MNNQVPLEMIYNEVKRVNERCWLWKGSSVKIENLARIILELL